MKPMLSPRYLTFLSVLGCLLSSGDTSAGLSGFSSANPYSREEQILNLEVAPQTIINYRDSMRQNVIMLSNFAKERKPGFEIMVHEGTELLKKGLWEYHLDGYNEARKSGFNADDPTFLAKLKQEVPLEETIGTSARQYVKLLDAIALNNYFCEKNETIVTENLQLISIDRCPDEDNLNEAVQDSVGRNSLLYAFIEDKYAFKDIKDQIIINENARNINSVKEASNIVFLLDTSLYQDKFAFMEDIRNSNFDVVIMPAFFNGKPFNKEEVHSLKFKKNGTTRRVMAVFNISETNDDEYYWKNDWKIGNPGWLKRLSFVNKNGIITEYWNPQWKKIISRYFKGIVDVGFDGVFFTGLDNYRYFEKQTPLE